MLFRLAMGPASPEEECMESFVDGVNVAFGGVMLVVAVMGVSAAVLWALIGVARLFGGGR